MKNRRTGRASEIAAETAYTRIHGRVPAWVYLLPGAEATRLLAVATSIGMQLAAIDHHAAEDAKRPKLGQMPTPTRAVRALWLVELLSQLRS